MSERDEYWVEEAPVDFTALQAQCRREEYVSVAIGKENVRVVFFEKPHTPEYEIFDEDSLVVAFGQNGTYFSTIVQKQTLESYDTISDFCQEIIDRPWLLFRPDAELASAKHEISRLLRHGIKQDELGAELSLDTIVLRAVNEMLHGRADWKALIELEQRASEPGGTAEFVVGFNIGYLLGRLNSGHEFLTQFEQAALNGFKLDGDQARRTRASGRKSTGDRDRRKQALLDKMNVISRDPSLQTPLRLKDLAEIAAKNCRAEDRSLWKQGYGQWETYLDELKSDPSTSVTIKEIRKRIRDF